MAVVVNKKTRVPYLYIGNDTYKNMHTGVEGIVDESKAKCIFNINLESTYLVKEYPVIKDLICKLNLIIDNDKI